MIPMKLPNPFILGCDVAGRILATGPGADQFQVGQRVWGSNQGLLGRQGTFAERIVVDQDWLYETPPQVTDPEAAALALVGITAHLGLVRHARLQPGDTLFVHGGSGGVGSAVVQMAKILGARVITSAGSPEKAKRCRQLGADVVLLYREESVETVVRQNAPEGVTVWWETRREPDFEKTVPLLARRGRMILMAGREARPVFPVGPFYVKDCSMHGFAMFNATAAEQRDSGEAINHWLQEGRLKAQIDRVLPLAEAVAAHRLQEENTIGKAGTVAGKIVLSTQ
jgi:NADPH2:quinone reductase